MGNACQCLKMIQGSPQKSAPLRQLLPNTQRNLSPLTGMINKEVEHKIQDNVKQSIQQSVMSDSSRAQAKTFSRRQSTFQSSYFGVPKGSSIIQSYIDSSSILILNPLSRINSQISSSQYYTLIDKIAFIKKTADRLKITTPAGLSQLNCQPQYMLSTLFIAEGLPLETLPQDIVSNQGMNRAYVQMNNSPLQLTIKLSCLDCNKNVKLTYCKAYISLDKVKCPKCEKIGKWSLLDIKANAPIWGEGRRILDHQVLQTAPNQIRLLGCVMCFKFGQLLKIDSCDCYVCKNCHIPGQQVVCPICNPF